MRKDPLVGRPQATPPAADGAKLGGGPKGRRLLDFSGRQSRGWGRERGPPRHDYNNNNIATTARLHYYNMYTLRAHTGAYFINKLDVYQFHRDIRHVGSQISRSLLRARDDRAPVGISGGTAPGGSF